jgi:hypothetical protein
MNEWMIIEHEVWVGNGGVLSFDVHGVKNKVRGTFCSRGIREDNANLDSLVANATLYVLDKNVQVISDSEVVQHIIGFWALQSLRATVNLGSKYEDDSVVIAIRTCIIPENTKRAKSLAQDTGVDIKLAAVEAVGSNIGSMPLSAVLLSELSNPTGSTAACLQRLGISALKRMVDLDLAFNTIDEAATLCSSLVAKDDAARQAAIAHRAEREAIDAKIELYRTKSELAEYQRKFYIMQMQQYQRLQQEGRM